jgi:hypothetical protein
MDVLLDDILISLLNGGINGIRNNNLNAIITAIDYLDTLISNTNFVTDDPYLSQNDQLAVINTRLREIYTQYRILFDVYRVYLEQTGGNVSYISWLSARNNSSPFNNDTPANYINRFQPIWYVASDTDGDGTLDEVVPERDGTNRTKTWVDSTTLSAGIYRQLRDTVDPSGGSLSGRTLRKPKGKKGRTKFITGGGGYFKGGTKGVDFYDYDDYGDPGDADIPDFVSGGGIRWEGEGMRDPRTGELIPEERENLGGGRPTEDAIRRERLRQEYIRTRGRILTNTDVGLTRSGDQVGRPGARLGVGGGIPVVPLGFNFGTPLSNAITVAPMAAPMGAAGAAGALGGPLSSTTATPSLFSSAPGLMQMNAAGNPGVPGPMAQGSVGSMQTSLAGYTPQCKPLYSFKIRQNVGTQPRKFFGFNIRPTPQLLVTMVSACPGGQATEIFTVTIDPYIHYTFSPTSRGEFNIIGSENSTLNSVGKIRYKYYYDFVSIAQKIYEKITEIILPSNLTIYDDIDQQLSDPTTPFCFVAGNTGILSNFERLGRKEEFLKPGNPGSVPPLPPMGFATTLPQSVRNYVYDDINWYEDTDFYTGMNTIENFFYMARTEYGGITFSDVVSSNTITGLYERTSRTGNTITSLIDSKITGELEQLSETNRTGTGNTNIGTGVGGGVLIEGPGGTPMLLDKFMGEYDDRFYGKLKWDFDVAQSVDCSSPYYRSSASVQGQMWFIQTDDQFGITDYEYASALTSQNLIDLNNINPTTGAVTGRIIDIIRSNVDPKTLKTNYGLREAVLSRGTNLESIPNNPCLEGIPVRYAWTVRRTKKIPIKIFCQQPGLGRVEIDYRVKGSNIWNWLVSELKKSSAYGARQNANGELLTNKDGYFYVEGEELVPLVGRTPNEPGTEWIQYESIRQNRNNANCLPVETVESTWVVDLDNPCGCDEIEVLTHYLTYPENKFKNPLDDNEQTFPSQRVLNERFPAPAPESKAAFYRLTLGQSLTDNRRQKPDCFEGTGIGRLHHPFLYGTDILPGMRKKSIKGLFNFSQSLECYLTSSTQTVTQKEYYYEITDCENCGKTAYFAVAYGNHKGSGSISSGYEKDDSPSKAIYSQYRLLTLDPQEKNFTFYDGGDVNTPDDIYVINYYRNGLSDKLDIGNFEINIAELSGSGKINSVHTGSNVKVSGSNPNILSLIDNSAIFEDENVCANDDPNYYYDIVSGSLSNGIHISGNGTLQTNPNLTTYGKVYPNLGVIVLDGHKLNVFASFNSVSGSSINGDNSYKLFTAISGAAALGKPMRARNVRFKTTNHYFVRIPSGEANYSTNPTYVFDSDVNKGKIKNACFIDNPMTYITTVGLYNSKRELIAVAKLSKPIKKTKENDVLIKIRLNW